MKLLKSKFTWLYLINILLISFLLVFGGQNYSVDSYSILVDGYVANIELCLSNYRFFGGLLYGLLSLLGHNPILNCTLDICFFIPTVSAALTALALKFYGVYEKKSLLSLAITDISLLISICNVWFCNILSFPECIFIAAIAIILTCCAVILLINSQKLLNCIFASVCMILATGIFQQFIILFTIYMIAYCCVVLYQKETNSIKEMLKIFVKPAVIVLASIIVYCAITFGTVAIFNINNGSRANITISHIIDRVLYYIKPKRQHEFLRGRGYFKTEFLTISYVAVVLTWFICLIVRAYKKKEFKKAFIASCAALFAYCSTYALYFVTIAKGVRVAFTLFSVFFLVSSGISVLCDKKVVKGAVGVLLCAVFAANAGVTISCELKQKSVNDADEAWAYAVLEEIDKYETEHNIKVTSVAYYEDSHCSGNAAEFPFYGDCSALQWQGSREYILNAYSEYKRFNRIDPQDDVFNEHFADKDWDEFNAEEQLFFDGDTLHLCCY